MRSALLIAAIGYITALCGLLTGAAASMLIKSCTSQKRLMGGLMGFTAGLLISFVCFSMLPASFEGVGTYFTIFFILCSVAVSCLLEGVVSRKKNLYEIKSGILLIIAVSLHNIPEGLALGSVLRSNFNAGLQMAVIIGVHCFPEAVAAFGPLKQKKGDKTKLFLLSFVIALPMGIGALMGAAISASFSWITAASLSFASGVMLYVACGEILPESKDVWRGRFSGLAAMVGFVIGIIIIGA